MSDTRPQGQPDEAMVDLLVKQVTEGLSPAEQRALDVMDSELASVYLKDLERAAAAVTLAGSGGEEPLPAALSARIAQQAAEHFARSSKVTGSSDVRTAAAKAAIRPSPAPARASRFGNYGWLAAAACLVLAIFGWERSPPPSVAVVTPAPVTVPPPEKPAPPPEKPVPPTAAEERAALLAKTDSLKIPLGASKDPAAAGVTGDVVWDPATQRGFLHFAGLGANDPAMHQYQIWIFDAGRDKRYPVDGGVFDVPANASDVIIPIRASLMVRKPAAFAVTLEKPGGVVVSGREHVIALGQAG
ncbi:MAG TPA: anti-sigma factor [Steroidobacteraceae bacterium]